MNIKNCPFCIISLEKSKIIKEKNYTRVVFSNPRLTPGHLLVISKRHVEKISELNKEEQKELLETVIEFQEKILKKVAKGCDIRQNYRPFQREDKLKIHHLHVHLQPRELFDELYKKCQIFEKDIFKELTEEEITKLIKIFK
jgi:ATP adenylyltransferase